MEHHRLYTHKRLPYHKVKLKKKFVQVSNPILKDFDKKKAITYNKFSSVHINAHL